MVHDAMTESTRKSTSSSARRPLVEVVTRGEPKTARLARLVTKAV